MTTLQEALTRGKGVERQFNCHIHDDKNASASVNILKGLWVCYACGAKGKIDGPIEIDPSDLLRNVYELIEENEIRAYPESWLMLYSGTSEYWESRFSTAAIEHFNLGFDPAKEEPCYPLRSPSGEIHGLVHRSSDTMSKRKYKYPYGVTITNYLFNFSPEYRSTVVLVEGAADAVSLWEVGIEAFAIYGTRPSERQMDLIRKVCPKRVVCAFDQDSSGRKAATEVNRMLHGSMEIVIASWEDNLGKDPAELTPEQRTSYIGSLII
jgi:DNA primase